MQDVILRPFSRRAEGDVGRTSYLRNKYTTFVNMKFRTFVITILQFPFILV